LGQDDAVLLAFAVADGDSEVGQVQVFDAQAEAFHRAQTAAVEELGHQEVRAGEVAEDSVHLLFGEDGREAFGLCSLWF